MQNLEYVAQKMSELSLHAPSPPLLTPMAIFFHNLLGQSIRTSMQNLEYVAQKIIALGMKEDTYYY